MHNAMSLDSIRPRVWNDCKLYTIPTKKKIFLCKYMTSQKCIIYTAAKERLNVEL